MLPEIQSFINSAYKDQAFFVPTEIFSEGFFLKVLFQFGIDHPDIAYKDENVGMILNNSQGIRFFCEGLLYSH